MIAPVQPAPNQASQNPHELNGVDFSRNYDLAEYHENHKGFFRGSFTNFMEWLGDAVITVPPKNRFWSSIGLTASIGLGYFIMPILTGRQYSGEKLNLKTITEEMVAGTDKKPDNILQRAMKSIGRGLEKMGAVGSINKVLDTDKPYDPTPVSGIVSIRDRWIRVAMYAIPAVMGVIGVTIASNFAFRKARQKVENCDFMEDYYEKISFLRGDVWSVASGFTAVMGSASGLSNIPAPGLNYGWSLATSTTYKWGGKRVTLPGFGELWSGNKVEMDGLGKHVKRYYYHGTKALLNHMIEYAVNNPSKTPAEFHAMAIAILGPTFAEVNAEHVEKFVATLHSIRDCYWKKGGVPKEKKAELRKELKEHFTGVGLEVTLEEIGLSPRDAYFNQGISAGISDIFVRDKVKKEMSDFVKKYDARADARVAERERRKAKGMVPCYKDMVQPEAVISQTATPPALEQLATPPAPRFADRPDIAVKAPSASQLEKQEIRRQTPDGEMVIA